MATEITSVTIPEYTFMLTETTVNDNTIRTYTNRTKGYSHILAVFNSPSGRDRQLVTIENGIDEFTEEFGDGPFSIYGQPFLNAKAAAGTDSVILHCIRVTAEDATYANRHIYVRYRVIPGDESVDPAVPASMEVMFIPRSTANLTNLKDLVTSAPVPEESLEDGWKEMRLMSIAATGRGSYGRDIRVRISNNYLSDKMSSYKNYYLNIFNGTTSVVSNKRVCMYPNALIGSTSYYLENIVNDLDGTINQITIDINEDALSTLFNDYQMLVDPETELTELTFDPILGINKLVSSTYNYSTSDVDASIPNYTIVDDSDLGTIQFESILGFNLENGTDGTFIPGSVGRTEALNAAYKKAFRGEYDRNVLSKYRCPLDAVFDADYDYTEVKPELAYLNTKRHEDHITYYDLGLDIEDHAAPAELVGDKEQEGINTYANTWCFSVDAYCGQIKDPYNYKLITLTSTYDLIQSLPRMWKENNGKHIPYAGVYGQITSFITNTIYPVYDEALDAEYLDRLKDLRINYAMIDAKQRIVRANQDTRYPEIGSALTVSNLTELNNAHIILDIKKDAEAIAADFFYRFNESSELTVFNYALDGLVNKYSAAQVKKIYAKPERTDEEAEFGILHLYIEVVHKALVKIVQIDIDVNRGVDES